MQQDTSDIVTTTLQGPPADRAPRRAGLIAFDWQADYPDSYHWLADILGCRANFPDAYLDQKRACVKADSLIAQAATVSDANARKTLYASIESDLFGAQGEMPLIPVFVYARALAIGPSLEVYPIHAGPLRFDQWVMTQ